MISPNAFNTVQPGSPFPPWLDEASGLWGSPFMLPSSEINSFSIPMARAAFNRVRVWQISGYFLVAPQFDPSAFQVCDNIGAFLGSEEGDDGLFTWGSEWGKPECELDTYTGGNYPVQPSTWRPFGDALFWNFSDQEVAGYNQNDDPVGFSGAYITLFNKWWWYKNLALEKPLQSNGYVLFQGSAFDSSGNVSGTIPYQAGIQWDMTTFPQLQGTMMLVDSVTPDSGVYMGDPYDVSSNIYIRPYKYWTWGGRFNQDTGL